MKYVFIFRHEDKEITSEKGTDQQATYVDSTVGVADYLRKLELVGKNVATSPCSYLSMKSCKQFPIMKSVEPLSKVLESMAVSVFIAAFNETTCNKTIVAMFYPMLKVY